MKKTGLIGSLVAIALMFNVGVAANVSQTDKKADYGKCTIEKTVSVENTFVVSSYDYSLDFNPVFILPNQLVIDTENTFVVSVYKMGVLKNKVYNRYLLHRNKTC
jgi:hypothetical protein